MAQSISSTRMGPSAVAGTVPQPPKVGIRCWQGQSRSRAPILIPCGPPHLLHPTRPPPAPATSWRVPWYLGDRKQWPWATHLYPGLRGGMPQLWMRSTGCPKKPARVPGWWHGSAPGSVELLVAVGTSSPRSTQAPGLFAGPRASSGCGQRVPPHLPTHWCPCPRTWQQRRGGRASPSQKDTAQGCFSTVLLRSMAVAGGDGRAG